MRYFFTANANRTIKSQDLFFRFEPTDLVGGTWHGVFSTENEAEIAALLALTSNGNVRELTLNEFSAELEVKKKARPSPPLTKSEPPPVPQARINNVPAELVDDPVSSGMGSGAEAPSNPAIESVDDVWKTAKVIPPEAPKQTARKKKAS